VAIDDPMLPAVERVRRTVGDLSWDPVPFLRDASDERRRSVTALWGASVFAFAAGQGGAATAVAVTLGSDMARGLAFIELTLLCGLIAAAWTGSQGLAAWGLRPRLRTSLVLLAHVPLAWGIVPVLGLPLAFGWTARNMVHAMRLRGGAKPAEAWLRALGPVAMAVVLGGLAWWMMP
jgi:hypothetical protein